MIRAWLVFALYGVSTFGQSSPTNLQIRENRTSDDDTVRAQITSLNQQLNDAAVKGDLAFFGKTMAPGYVGVAPNGMILDKSVIAAHYQSGSLHYEVVAAPALKIFRPELTTRRESCAAALATPANLLRSWFVLHLRGSIIGCFFGVSRGFLRLLLRGFHRLIGGCFCVGGSLFRFFLGGFHGLGSCIAR